MGVGAGAAAAIGAGISAAGGLAGAAMQSGATSKAAGAAAQDQRIAFLMADQYNKPYREAGESSLGQINALMGLRGPDAQGAAYGQFRTDPGYQFARDEGLDAVQRAQNAAHILDSGDTSKATMRYAEGLAAQQFGQYVNRLFGLSQLGQSAANQQATSALTTGANLGNIAMGQGAADASIYGNAAKGVGDSVNNYMNNSLYADRTNRLFGGYGTDTTYTNPATGTSYVSSSNPNLNF